jgi:hypothetical protein
MVRAARIVLDRPERVSRSWCWRDEWLTGFDSSYGLFSKFALLNVMTAREIAQIFVSSNCGKRQAILARPNVDLRDSSVFDLVGMSHAMHVDLDAVRHAFLVDLLPQSHRKSVDYLRWCSKCAAFGFHTPIFQLAIVSDCPIHGIPLHSHCKHCNAQIPYRFRDDVMLAPFACPSCAKEFASSMRDPRTKSFRSKPRDYTALENVIRLMAFEDQIFPIKMELNRARKSLALGEVVISKADWRRKESEYTGFVIQVLRNLQAEVESKQVELPLQGVAEIVLGARSEPPLPRRLRDRKRKRAKTEGVERFGPSASWDQKLQDLYDVYKAIRRHLWRRVVKQHRDCIYTAAKRLWWYVEGEVTPHICPVAEAFIRWRMYWEGTGIPQSLVCAPSKPPYGIMCWQAEAAPVCPAGWSPGAEQWVIDHVFAMFCLANFRDWLSLAYGSNSTKQLTWTKHAATGKFDGYWAVTGHDSWQRPLRLFLSESSIPDPTLKIAATDHGALHKQVHQDRLKVIQR